MKKVAIIQNRLQPGGRMQVILEIIRILNSLGIAPDLLTLKSRINREKIEKGYRVKLDFAVREISSDLRLPFEQHIIYFNWLVNKFLTGYDLVINSNNTSFGLKKSEKIISYVHFPRKYRNLSKMVSTHFPDGPFKSWFNPHHFFLKLAGLSYKLDTNINTGELIIANSEYTRMAVENCYPGLNIAPEVIYPPVRTVDVFSGLSRKDKKQVVSLGRFAPDKRQLEQIRIAEKLPELTFNIIGFAGTGNAYFERCREYVSSRNIPNVKLYPDAEFDKMQILLQQSMFFIHSLRNEPFGITAVQAIARGCVPVVHDSGGQTEIVPLPELRYQTMDEAIAILKRLPDKPEQELLEIQKRLQQNIVKFDESGFDDKFRKILKEKLK